MLSKLCSFFCIEKEEPLPKKELQSNTPPVLQPSRSTEQISSIQKSISGSVSGDAFKSLVEILRTKTDVEFFSSFAHFNSDQKDNECFNEEMLVKLFYLEVMVSEFMLLNKISNISNRDITAWIRSEPRIFNVYI